MPATSTMILNALVMTGEKPLGSTLDTDEQRYYLSRLNSMIDSWTNERLMINQLSQTSFSLTASQGTYTIGNGGNFNMTRPTRIVDPCFIRDSDNSDSELEIIDMTAYGRLVLKTSDGTYPSYLAYDYGFSATSTASVYLYPEPDSGLTLFINTLQPLTNFSTMSQNLIMPPGYQDAIESNFAVRSAPGFIQVSQDLKDHAVQAKKAIKSQNLPAPVSRLDYGIAGTGRSNILTGP